MQEYPKVLYGNGWEDVENYVLVVDEKDEAFYRKEGFDDLPELEEIPLKPLKPTVDSELTISELKQLYSELTRSELKQLYFELSGKQASSKIGTAKLKQAILNLEG